jgi:hypothetical protein
MSVTNHFTKFSDKFDDFMESVFEKNNGLLTRDDWDDKCAPELWSMVIDAMFKVKIEEMEEIEEEPVKNSF